jgi:hypothetical protein
MVIVLGAIDNYYINEYYIMAIDEYFIGGY